jgi:hypothetical protein
MSGGGAGGTDPAALAAEMIAAINERDPERLGAMLDERSRVVTGRTAHTGAEAIQAWAAKEYDHLIRRFEIDSYRAIGLDVLATGAVQYVWLESGEVADSTPIALEISFREDVLGTLRLHDDAAAALASFES